MSNVNFDTVAKTYDWLAKIVFGNKIKQAQTVFLNQIQEGDNVLIIGGGTGWILEEVDKIKRNISITYIESSSNMMKLSMKRKVSNKLKLTFIESTFLDYKEEKNFDVVCTFFFLDLFWENELQKTITRINELLKPKAKWLFSDFALNSKSPFHQKFLVKLMFLFFRLISNIQSKRLLDYQERIINQGFEVVENQEFKKGLIQSTFFLKQ